MAQNTSISIAANTWTLLTDSNVSSATFQNVGSNFILVKATTNTTAPTDTNGALRYNPGQGERNAFLSDLFPGISGVRLWARSPDATQVVISHA